MNVEYYKQRLLEKERELLERMKAAGIAGREAGRLPDDPGSDPVVDALKEVQFAEADSQWAVLRQVRDALERIDQGTFGTCVVDGAPIDEERLNAIPWTAYCLKHQQLLERATAMRAPTL